MRTWYFHCFWFGKGGVKALQEMVFRFPSFKAWIPQNPFICKWICKTPWSPVVLVLWKLFQTSLRFLKIILRNCLWRNPFYHIRMNLCFCISLNCLGTFTRQLNSLFFFLNQWAKYYFNFDWFLSDSAPPILSDSVVSKTVIWQEMGADFSISNVELFLREKLVPKFSYRNLDLLCLQCEVI